MKIISWNVNGIRAAEKKGLYDFLLYKKPDVLCLQETKAQQDNFKQKKLNGKNIFLSPGKYNSYWSSAEKKGYSGVVTYTKEEPLSVKDLDKKEGRIVMTEFKKFYLFNVYFPNGKMSSARLKYKMKFYDNFLSMIKRYEKSKPVIFCGDVNTAHKEIDLAHPKANEDISGFLPKERKWIDKVIKNGYIDAFRLFNKKPNNYTWWSVRTSSRSKNIGWRVDYFFVSEKLKKNIKSCKHLTKVMGSDHCPISLELKF